MSRTDSTRVVGYWGAHDRIRAKFGPASDHACAECGRPARDWSYDHGDPDEWWEVRTDPFAVRPYSLDSVHYQPLCRPCHVLRDSGSTLERCKRDHEFTPENTRISPSRGHRTCRACERERDKRRVPRRRS